MNAHAATEYRRAVARVNYMAQDRCDLSSASKAMTQSMSNPRAGYDMLVKRVIRYLRNVQEESTTWSISQKWKILQ